MRTQPTVLQSLLSTGRLLAEVVTVFFMMLRKDTRERGLPECFSKWKERRNVFEGRGSSLREINDNMCFIVFNFKTYYVL